LNGTRDALRFLQLPIRSRAAYCSTVHFHCAPRLQRLEVVDYLEEGDIRLISATNTVGVSCLYRTNGNSVRGCVLISCACWVDGAALASCLKGEGQEGYLQGGVSLKQHSISAIIRGIMYQPSMLGVCRLRPRNAARSRRTGGSSPVPFKWRRTTAVRPNAAAYGAASAVHHRAAW